MYKVLAYIHNKDHRSRYYEIEEASREALLQVFKPKFPNVKCTHITWRGDPLKDKPPHPNDVEVIGYAIGNNIEAVVVSINGQVEREDGNLYHITISLDESKGAKPIDSNEIVKKFKRIKPFEIYVQPAKKMN